MALSSFLSLFSIALLSTCVQAQLSGSVGPTTTHQSKAETKICNVKDYGAVNGHPEDDFATPFAAAWSDCGTGGLIYIPEGNWYMHTAVAFDHGSNVAIQLDGIIYRYYPMDDDELIHIYNSDDVEFFSGNSKGAIQGYGYQYLSQGEYGIRLIRIEDTSNFSVHGIALVDSPSYYLTLASVTNGEIYNMIMRGVSIGETDAIDVWGSNMWIHDIEITNGDECVTTKSPAENFLIEDIYCNWSGGCAVGSLGLDTAISSVDYNHIYCNHADAAYLKTSGGSGYVDGMTWDHITVINGSYPLAINEAWGSDNGGEGVQLSSLTYSVSLSPGLTTILTQLLRIGMGQRSRTHDLLYGWNVIQMFHATTSLYQTSTCGPWTVQAR